jgi:hypothetical protein
MTSEARANLKARKSVTGMRLTASWTTRNVPPQIAVTATRAMRAKVGEDLKFRGMDVRM